MPAIKTLTSLILTAAVTVTLPAFAGQGKGKGKVIDCETSKTVDANETQHLIFMRQEEKLARDVYITLGMKYPDMNVFGNIAESEERHTCSVSDKLAQYGIEDPVVNQNVGVFEGELFGAYFTDTYRALVSRGDQSGLEALYTGALIEELDMHDIVSCPDIIVKTDNGINSADECGRVYTDNADIQRLYTSLLEGSESHLRAFVGQIEKQIGEGNYKAQILTQQEVDRILGR